MARPITFFPHLCLPCPIYMPRIRGYGSSSPPKAPKTESFPKLPWIRNKTPKSLKNLLPVFHFAVCVCFPHLCTNPSRKEEGGQGAVQLPKPAVAAWVPGHPLPSFALRSGETSGLCRSRSARPPSELLVFAATSSFYRFGCAERRGYYRSNAVLSLFPPPRSRPLFM